MSAWQSMDGTTRLLIVGGALALVAYFGLPYLKRELGGGDRRPHGNNSDAPLMFDPFGVLPRGGGDYPEAPGQRLTPRRDDGYVEAPERYLIPRAQPDYAEVPGRRLMPRGGDGYAEARERYLMPRAEADDAEAPGRRLRLPPETAYGADYGGTGNADGFHRDRQGRSYRRWRDCTGSRQHLRCGPWQSGPAPEEK